MRPERLARWLFCPANSVAAHWGLLAEPRRLLAALPRLWAVEAEGSADPRGPRSDADATPEDILNEFLEELDARRTTFDRAASWFIVVVLWGSILAMLVPPALFLGRKLWRRCQPLVPPLAAGLQRWGAFEVAAYTFALALSAQGFRYPTGAAGAGLAVSLAGGLAFAPCWAYSTALHAKTGAGPRRLLLAAGALGALLQSLVLAPLAVAHRSALAGALSVAALHSALAAAVHCLGAPRAKGGLDPGSGTHCLALASALLALAVLPLRALGPPPWAQVFAPGLAIFGPAGYLAAVLAVASKWRSCWDTYIERQAFAVMSLLTVYAWGRLRSAAALTSTSYMFALLFVLAKELENKFDHVSIKALAAYVLIHRLYSDRECLSSLLEPASLYA